MSEGFPPVDPGPGATWRQEYTRLVEDQQRRQARRIDERDARAWAIVRCMTPGERRVVRFVSLLFGGRMRP